MALQFKIKKGSKENLPKTGEKGCWYLTTDTHELFACLNEAEGDLTLHKVNDDETFNPTEITNKVNTLETDVTTLKALGTKTYDSYASLPNVGSEEVIYIIKDENATYRWVNDGKDRHYVCVGRDYSKIAIIDGGTAGQFTK